MDIRPLPLLLVSCWVAIASACVGSSPPSKATASESTDDRARQSNGPVETRKLAHPVINAVELRLSSTTEVGAVSGVVYITRQGKAIKNPSAGEPVLVGDLLQITQGSTIELRRSTGEIMNLSSQHGEWFKFTQ